MKIKIFSLAILLLLNNFAYLPKVSAQAKIAEPVMPAELNIDESVLSLPIPEEVKPILIDPELKPDLLPIEEPGDILVIEPKPDNPEIETLTEEDPEPNFDKGENKISLEKLNLKTEGNSGALVYDFPLAIPQGRNGLQPNLALSYNNQDTEKLNQFGYGWSLNLPSIKRINKNGSDNLYAESFFSSSLSGELKLVNSLDGLHGEYQAEVESGDFIKYELTESNYWQATDKTGTVYIFGFDTNSRQDNPSDQAQIYQWFLSETRDTNDNYIKYEYFKDAGQIYPDTITYTGSGEIDGIFSVEFLREGRADNLDSNNAGFNVINNYRISEIDISINDNWVKKYELDYITGNNGQASYLDTILESAKDESNNIVSLPINDFDYQETVKSFALDENYEFPVYFTECSSGQCADKGVEIADVNGDGLEDVIRAFGRPTPVKQIYINDGDGWALDTSWEFPLVFIDGPSSYDQGVRLADVNGDGLIDIIRGVDLFGEPEYRQVLINNGSGWDLDESWEFPLIFINSGYDQGVRLVDINADGLVDIIKAYNKPGIADIQDVYINNGSGWDLDESWEFPVYFVYDVHDWGVRLVDVNEDGLVDVLHGYGTYNDVYINNGVNWALDENYSLPITMFAWGVGDVGVRPFDINADGFTDVVRSWRQSYGELASDTYINNGSGWDINENYEIPLPFVEVLGNSSHDLYTRLADLNGDNVLDLVRSVNYGTASNYDPAIVKKMYINNAQIESLSTIKNSQGSEINISYKPSTQYKDEDGDLLNPNLPFVVQTVKQITINDGLDNESTIDYQYSDGQYYYNNPQQRKVAGFGQVEKIIDDTKTITYYHQGNESNSSQGEYQDSYSKIGRPYRSETYDNNTDELLNQTIYKWEEIDLGHDNSFVYNTLKSSTDFSNSTKSTAIQYQYDTTTGNLLNENNLGQVNINTNTGEITNQLTGDEKNTNYDYAQNLDDHILAAPMTKVISDSTDSKEQNLYYDNLDLGEVAKVNLTKEDYIEQDVEVNRNFNNLGLVTEEISPENATTTIAYDTYNMYPTTSTDPLNNITYTEYNLLNGQVATTTAPNGLVTVNKYDAFGRLKEVWISNPDSPSNLIKKQEISYQDITLPRYKESKDYFDNNLYTTTREYYDGLDRVIQKKSSLASTNEFTTLDISYDSQGRVARQSLPYITSSIVYSSADLSKPAKTYTYDALGRVLTEVTPVGATNYDYNGFTTQITDANNNRKDLTKDAYGNLVQVKEYNGASVYTTNYEYTLTNKLKKITDSAGNIRNFSYDALDNLEWQDMVHKTSVANPAKIQYTYDKNGNVLTETSFKNDAISYTYDDLNRPLLEKLSGNTKISYIYDQHGDIGQLSFADYGNGNSKAYDYDILGRLKTATTTIADEVFVMEFDYNLAGALKTIKYPDNKTVSYNFNAIGQVSGVNLATSTLATNITYNQNGQMTHVERASGVITDYTYDPAQAFRLTRILSLTASSTLQDLNYTYDAVGNLLTLTDNANTDLKKSATYVYDDLNRLLSATLSYPNHPDKNYIQSFTYDSIGNMITNSDLGTLNYNNGQPHQLSSYGSRNFQYDAAGNMTRNGGINKFSWDYRNRLSLSNDIASNNNTYYQYDHNNQRFLKYTEDYIYYPPDPQEELPGGNMMMYSESIGGSELDGVGYWAWTVVSQDKYIDKYFEKNIAEQTKSHVFLNNVKLATINNDTNPYFVISDHLNSSSILTTSSGNIAEITDYKPYGTTSYANTIQDLKDDYKFTGQEYDEESSLQYFGARYMDNEIGRFLSIDPAMIVFHDPNEIQNITNGNLQKILFNPQSLNSYAYVNNNPIKYNDPTGEWPDTIIDVGFIIYDLYKIGKDIVQTGQAQDENVKALGADAAGALIPGVTGLGLMTRASNKADDVTRFLTSQNEINRIIKSVDNAFDEAVSGGKHSGLLNNYLQRSIDEIEKGVKSLDKRINEHINKLNNPTQFDDFVKGTDQYKQGLINKWKNEIRVFQEKKNIFEKIIDIKK